MILPEDPTAVNTVPMNAEAEKAVLGAVLINPEVYHECRLEVPDGAREFWTVRYQYVWQALENLTAAQIPIDYLTIIEQLRRDGTQEEIGGSAYISGLITSTPTSLNASAYAAIIHEYYLRRRMLAAANEIANLAYGNTSLEEAIGKSTKSLSDAVGLMSTKHTISIADSVRVVDQLVEERKNSPDLPGIPTPWVDMNRMMSGGAQNSDVNMIVGRPGDGKTSALMQLALYGSKYPLSDRVHTRHVFIFSCEMGHEQLTRRLIAQISGIPYGLILSGRIPDDKWPAYYNAIDELASLTITIDGKPAASPHYIRSKLELISARQRVDMVCVDSLNLMKSGMNFKLAGQEPDYNATELKTIARDFDLPVWLSHQLNRSKEQRGKDARPQLSDLREGGEQPVDSVIFIHHEKDEKDAIKESNFIFAKHRNGPVGDVPIAFIKEKFRFESATKVAFPRY
jgi:replicative DNA helicase